jgi:hypothetical protein
MPYRTARQILRQQGAAMVEFAAAALPLLFGALFVIEAARWHITRQMLHLALLEASRAGATAHGRPAVMEQAFERALLPLFQPAGRHGSPQARMRAAFVDVARQTGTLPWRIDVLSPSAPAFADFGDAALHVPAAPGRRAIRNDYQAEQHARRRRMGWPGGRGPLSGQTIFEANTLRLRLSYIHPPLAPGMRGLLRRWAAMRGSRDPAARAGLLTIVMEIALPMQSHPVSWGHLGSSTAWDRLAKGLSGPAHTGLHSRSGHAAAAGASVGAGPGPIGFSRGQVAARVEAGLARESPLRFRSGGDTAASMSGNGNERAAKPDGAAGTEAQPDAACGVLLCCPAHSAV